MKASDLIDFNNYIVNWEAVELVPEFNILNDCQQNPKFHGEGNVMNHTKAVVNRMINIIHSWNSMCIAKTNDVNVLLTAALFHDIGKGVTTKIGKDGNWHSYRHEFEGEKITRRLLWDEDIIFREKVCALVKYHMLPLDVFKHTHYIEDIIKLSTLVDLDLLFFLKRADCEGSIHDNVIRYKESILLSNFKKISEGIKTDAFQDATLFDANNFDYLKPTVFLYIMIGLPGSGKNTLIENWFNDDITPIDGNYLYKLDKNKTVVLSRDDIRTELGYCSENQKIVGTKEQEDNVSDVFNNRLLQAASEKKTIIINNINLKKKYREEIINKLSDYNVIVSYIYVEAKGIEKNIERRKNNGFTKEIFDGMIENFDWPDFFEHKNIFYIFKN